MLTKLIKNCKIETLKHIDKVGNFINDIAYELEMRAITHDDSKLKYPELEVFAEYTPKLKDSTYGSDEYKEYLIGMGKALEHHYQNNRHHPEHFENGIKDMDLIDIIEMLCDWKAATLRHDNGDIRRSIEINQERFGYSDELKQIFLNTVRLFKEEGGNG